MVSPRRILWIVKLLVDAVTLAGAFGLAFFFRFEGAVPSEYAQAFLLYVPFVVLLKWGVIVGTQTSAPWRFISLRETMRLGRWLAVTTALIVVAASIARYATWAGLPLSVIGLDFLFAFVGLVGVRALTRLVCERSEHRAITPSALKRVPTLLCGAGRAGALVAKEILARPDSEIQLVGFIDDDEHLGGMHVEGLPVLGTLDQLDRIARTHGVAQVIITIARAQDQAIPRIARRCEASGLRTKIIPPLHEIVAGEFNLAKLRPVSIEDLLRRRQITLDLGDIEKIVRDRTVLVTGAGGSIGSELCRTIARLQPAKLVLVEQAENSLFHIHMALIEAHPNLCVEPCIADVCDETRMHAVFGEYRPSLVLHAAAHKHVPMMEWNPGEAIKNNVIGTRTLALLADHWRVERFVMISTDKAVNPTSVMGVSKRVAELLVQAFNQKSDTRFMIVRFGNVLGSAGSVIPIFQKQIAQGGPVTVTHPEMKRYFMTIPEACQLVLQAGAMGSGGELFVLDMGEPVKIVDLARDLIRLSGLTPEHDIAIRFTGLRPGEKLFEELSLNEEDLLKTAHPRIFIGRVKAPALSWITDQVDELGDLATRAEITGIYAKLKDIVPEYTCTKLRLDAPAPVIGPPHHRDSVTFAS